MKLVAAKPYYEDDLVTLYHGDFREVAQGIANVQEVLRCDAVITDPPYGETSLDWDRWVFDWPHLASSISDALWCFGSFRMFHQHAGQFRDWKFSHEVVWQKQNGTGFATDKFRRVHELATFWYRGAWGDIRHEVPRVAAAHDANESTRRSRFQAPHAGATGPNSYVDDGMRLMPSVIKVANEQSRAVHPTQKPVGIVAPLIQYSVPVGGLVVDLFAGSGTTLLAAKLSGRRAIGFEVNEKYAEAAARRLAQQAFDLEGIA